MDFFLQNVLERSEKLRVIKECDDAFTISITGRSNFNYLFNKIDKYAVFVAAYTLNKTIAGYSAFYANDQENYNAFLTLFCVRKEMQKLYLGSKLMEFSLNLARNEGMNSMELEVLKEDTVPIMFYRKCGFSRTVDNTDSDFITMRRAL